MIFFFNDTATTEIYTLSLHDALPISERAEGRPHRRHDVGRGRDRSRRHPVPVVRDAGGRVGEECGEVGQDRKSTRLNSSHANISYAVFCLKKKKKASGTQQTVKLDRV